MEMEAVPPTGLDSSTTASTSTISAAAQPPPPLTSLFSVKEEPLDFDLIGKVEGDLDLDLGEDVEKKVLLSSISTTTSSTSSTATSSNSKTAAASVPQIGSSNSAFQPYKQQSLTILTNLQRGNVKTTNKENGPESLTFHEKAAKASLTDADITESTVNTKDPNGYTPLMWAAFHGRLQIVQKLIEKGAQLDCYGPEGETALMFSACNGHIEVLQYLLSKGVDADTEDDAGNTALMFAAYGNHADCVIQLLKKGASMSKPNGIGDTPFEIAINKGHLAAQYAMEDFLKEEIENNILQFSSNLETNNSSGLSNGCSSNSTTISNGNCNSNSNSSSSNESNNLVVITNCNGIGEVVGSLENGGGNVVSFSNGGSIVASTSSGNSSTSSNNNHHK